MSIDFNNYIQFEAFVGARLSLALDNTLDRLLIELQNIIESTVYGTISPSARPWGVDSDGTVGLTSGNRTGQFYDSWQSSKSVVLGNLIEGEISQAMDVMQQFMVGGRMVHEDGSNLANIIESGLGYNFGQMEGIGREFWSEFTTFCLTNLENIFVQECAKVGLPLQRSYADITMI